MRIGLPPYKGYKATSIQRNILGKYKGVFGGALTYPGLNIMTALSR